MAFDVVFPVFVTVCKFGVVPDGQFVPSARQICFPFTCVPAGSDAIPVTAKFVEVVFVPVAFVQIKFVGLNELTIKFVNDAFVANKFVDVEFVDVVFVKIAPAGVVRPIVVRLIVPPITVMFEDVSDVIVAVFAKRTDDVTYVDVTFVKNPFVPRSVVLKRSVPVADPNPRILIVPDADVIEFDVIDPMLAVFALNVEPEAFTNVRFVDETFANVELAAISAPITPLLE